MYTKLTYTWPLAKKFCDGQIELNVPFRFRAKLVLIFEFIEAGSLEGVEGARRVKLHYKSLIAIIFIRKLLVFIQTSIALESTMQMLFSFIRRSCIVIQSESQVRRVCSETICLACPGKAS